MRRKEGGKLKSERSEAGRYRKRRKKGKGKGRNRKRIRKI